MKNQSASPAVVKTAVIDGDFAIYWVAYLSQNETNVTGFIENLLNTIDMWTVKAGCVNTVIALSRFRKPNFRHRIYPEYKSHRKGRELPEFVPAGYGYLEGGKGVKCVDDLEADDLMGIAATSCKNIVIVSPDKDMLTIPGEHWNPRTEEYTTVTPAEAEYRFAKQWLTGDATDSIPGLPGIGPVKAAKILGDTQELFKKTPAVVKKILATKVAQAYKDAGQKKAYWIQQGRLVRILTAENWDTKKRKMKMWEPPDVWPAKCTP